MHYIYEEQFRKNPLLLGQELKFGEVTDLYYLALILPYVGFSYLHKGKSYPVYEFIINEGLKVFFSK